MTEIITLREKGSKGTGIELQLQEQKKDCPATEKRARGRGFSKIKTKVNKKNCDAM